MDKTRITLKILDEVNVVFIGLRQEDTHYLVQKYALFAKDYRFMTKFKLGIWDGKIQFFKNSGKTYLHLLSEILPYLSKQGYSIKLVDKRLKFTVELDEIDEFYFKDHGITLGDHQRDAINKLTQNGGGIFIGGTGSGKTICAAALCKLYYEELNLRTIVIVPTSDLIDQTIEEFSQFIDSVGEYSGTKKETSQSCVVSTWQALKNNKAILSKFQVAIVDEAHSVRGEVLRDMLNTHGSNICVKIGVTGTLPNEEIDAMCVRITLGEVVQKTTAKELIECGWLATPTLKIFQLEEDVTDEYDEYKTLTRDIPIMTYAKFKQNLFPDFVSEKKHIQSHKLRLEYLVSEVSELRRMDKGNTFILVNGVVFGKKLAKHIPNAYFVYGKDEKAARKKIYELYKENDDIVVISTFQLASTGLNIKRIFNLLLVDGGKSYIQIIQSIGRGLRKAHDKDEVYILDICSDLKYARRHLSERMAHYKAEGYEFTKTLINYKELIG